MKRQRRFSGIGLVTLLFLLVIGLLVFIPFMFLIISSLQDASMIFSKGLTLKIDFGVADLDNYKLLFTHNDGIYWVWFKNSVVITFIQTVVVLVLCSMVGYGLALYDFKGRQFIFAMVLVMMMVPGDILLIPLYKLITNLGLMDTYLGVILPGIVPPATIFFFRQYAIGLSKEYADAARIDGCGEFRIFWNIYAPMMKPAFGAMSILTSMNVWNNYLWPMIVLRSDENLMLPAGLMTYMTPYGNNYDIVFAGSVMSIIPIIIVFMLNQKQFIAGLTVGGVKG